MSEQGCKKQDECNERRLQAKRIYINKWDSITAETNKFTKKYYKPEAQIPEGAAGIGDLK